MIALSANTTAGLPLPFGPGPHPEYDASLLFWRMATLHIDREWLASEDPLLFRELQGFCTLCPSKQQCTRDLASDLRAARVEYCPNAGSLNLLEALACCLDTQPAA
jgi:hypothetical protein